MDERLEHARKALAAAEAAVREPSTVERSVDSISSDSARKGGTALGPEHEDTEVFAAARAMATRTLAHHARTRHQLATKLAARNFDPEVVERTLAWCEQHGLIDDASYAANFVKEGHQSRGLGRAALRHKLLDRGVDATTVEEHLGHVNSESERSAAEHLVRRRLSALAGLDRTTVMRRLGAQLGRRGFDAELAYSVIRQEIDQHPAFGRD